jgi:hypothetical protein
MRPLTRDPAGANAAAGNPALSEQEDRHKLSYAGENLGVLTALFIMVLLAHKRHPLDRRNEA